MLMKPSIFQRDLFIDAIGNGINPRSKSLVDSSQLRREIKLAGFQFLDARRYIVEDIV